MLDLTDLMVQAVRILINFNNLPRNISTNERPTLSDLCCGFHPSTLSSVFLKTLLERNNFSHQP